MATSSKRRSSGQSRAGASDWSSATTIATTSADTDLESGSRYDLLDELGAGGMGTVFAAFDARLGREVALKKLTVNDQDSNLAARLANEARVTAGLEHPSIVPVYDAGRSNDGHAYYTMRMVRGRSLADAIAEATDLDARLALLPHFVDTCQAIAFAHSRDVAHRDIKPANIMVGSFGETYVVDWGLAGSIADDTTSDGGTIGYMSPEQLAGEVSDARADVWSLGATLHALLYCCTPQDGHGTVTQRIPELDAIAARATADDPTDRYQSASALVADLRAYLEGRRVSVYSYSSADLVARIWRAWKTPIVVSGLALAAIAITGALSWNQMRTERTRALQAEQHATSALDETNKTLAWALEQQATSAQATGDQTSAQVVAAHALSLRESPTTRGVLAGISTRPFFRHVTRHELPSCTSMVVGPAPNHVLCVTGGSTSLWHLDEQRALWTIARRAEMAALSLSRVLIWNHGTGYELLDIHTGQAVTAQIIEHAPSQLVSADTGHHLAAITIADVIVFDARSGQWNVLATPCGKHQVSTGTITHDRVVVACSDGIVRATDHKGSAQWSVVTPYGGSRPPASAIVTAADNLVMGGIDGTVAFIDRRHPTTAKPTRVSNSRIAQLAYASDKLVAVRPERGHIRLWNPIEKTALAAFPVQVSRAMMAGPGRSITLLGSVGLRGELGSPLPRTVFSSAAGLSSAAAHVGRSMLAAARGDGVVTAWSLTTGARLAEVRVSRGVVKRLGFSEDGTLLLAGVAADEGTVTIDTTSWRIVPNSGPHEPAKRVAVMADDYAIAFGYRDNVVRWKLPSGKPQVINGARFTDISLSADRIHAALLSDTGSVWSMTRTGALSRRFRAPAARAVATDSAQQIATVGRRGVRIWREGKTRRLEGSPTNGDDIAFSPRSEFLAVATRDGSTWVWRLRDDRLIAVLRGHTARVAYVGFIDDGRLMTASWDGDVRLWNMNALRMRPGEQLQLARDRWRLNVDELVSGRTTE